MRMLQRLTLLLILFISLKRAESLSPVPAKQRDNVIRYRGRVAYDGNGFQGFQLQPADARTIQGDLEKVLTQRFQCPVRVVGAGRTDAGVHARGQAIHFELPADRVQKEKEKDLLLLPQLEYTMNRMLRQDVRVYNLQEAPMLTKELNGELFQIPWNAIHDTTGKLYIYRISTSKSMDPLERHSRFDLKYGYGATDIQVLERTLKHFEGYHDFRAFAGGIVKLEKNMRDGETMDTHRAVYNITMVDEGEDNNGNYRIEIRLKGALYKMVRNMVGTALEVACGKMTEDEFLRLLHRADPSIERKTNKAQPAPPQGLTLEQVYYDDY